MHIWRNNWPVEGWYCNHARDSWYAARLSQWSQILRHSKEIRCNEKDFPEEITLAKTFSLEDNLRYWKYWKHKY